MADPPDEQFIPPSRAHTPETVLRSSPPRPSSQHTRPKGNPTVTPRRLRQFFTPRSSSTRVKRFGTGRVALSQLSPAAANKLQSPHKKRPSKKDTIRLNDDSEVKEGLAFKDITPSRKRRQWYSPGISPEHSSPVKRLKRFEKVNDCSTENDWGTLSDSDVDNVRRSILTLPKPIIKSRYRGAFGAVFRRELDISVKPWIRSNIDYCGDWQHETTHFYSQFVDVHHCVNVAGAEPDEALPFCTASCNSNTLIAIGDEEGAIRILESAKDEQPGFQNPCLAFRQHPNAILDLAFSSDDLLLATASGDQTSVIIDMPTQRGIYTLQGHISSIKQVRFQPGSSNNVIATCSRDGNVSIWDLRCKGKERLNISQVYLDETADPRRSDIPCAGTGMAWVPSTSRIFGAHTLRGTSLTPNSSENDVSGSKYGRSSKGEPYIRSGDVSVTALSFLSPSRSHLLLTTSEASACVKLWDVRNIRSNSRNSVPLSSTELPASHNQHRHFGLTSMTLSSDGARLYTLCRDNSVYAYSTSHLILGSAPELSETSMRKKRHHNAEGRKGLGPLYGFRHPSLHVATFYIKLALREAKDDRSELLAVGSSDACIILFPTDERYMQQRLSYQTDTSFSDFSPTPNFPSHPPLSHSTSSVSTSNTRLNDNIPIYQHGSALINGHMEKEVTGLCWSTKGELISVADDYRARVWREGPKARDLRIGGEGEGRRWGMGWAEISTDSRFDASSKLEG